jgi:hypothetical protein
MHNGALVVPNHDSTNHMHLLGFSGFESTEPKSEILTRKKVSLVDSSGHDGNPNLPNIL